MSNILYAYTKLVFCMLVSNSFKYNSSNIFSTRQNNDWIYKNEPVQKLTYPLILILDVIPWMSFPGQLFFFFVIVVHESFVGPEQTAVHSLVFQHLLHIWPLSKSDCMILRSIFHIEDNWGTHATITKGEHFYWRSRRQHDALRGRSCKLFESDKQGKLCLFWLLGNMQIFM